MSHDTKPATLSLEEKRRLLVQKLQRGGQEQDRFPLSFAQQRLWVVHQMDPESPAYNMPYALRLRGPLDGEVLGRALTALARRHATLRTVFPAEQGVPVQRILPAAPVAPREVDLRGLAPGAREAEAERLAREEAERPFDLAAGPLMRVSLLRLAADDAVVLFTLHHVVSDGWSQNVLARDLSELYTALAEGRPPVLPPLSTHYAEYAVWQRGWLSGAVMEEQLGFWRERLAGAPPLLELPTDRPRTSAPGGRAERCSFAVPAETAEALRALSRREDASLFMTLLAVFQALLSRWSGQEDVVVGTPVAGRSRLEVENLIGFFVNMLAQRTDLSGDPSVRELIGRVRQGVLGALAHEHVPFEKLVDELQVERSATHSPLFQVVFTLEAAGAGTLRLGGLHAETAVWGEPQAKFDLSLSLTEVGGSLAGSFLYRAGLFDPATIERMAEHFVRMVRQAAADPDLRLSRLELAGDEERRQVLEAWNGTDGPFPREACIHALFQARAAERPEAVALVWDDARLTYGELDARANRLARHLAALGVGPDARVGVLLERGPEMVVSFLAVLKAGGGYVPLDPGWPDERLGLVLADSGVRVLLTQDTAGAGPAVPAGAAIVSLDGDRDVIAARSALPPRGGATARSLAYVIYTSGSTGTPKGVAVEHRGVVRLVRNTDYVRLTPSDRVAQASSAAFDAATFEIWGALLNGAALVGVSRDAALAPAALEGAIRASGITTLFLTTALFNQVARELPGAFASLRYLLFGGEAVDPAAVRRVLRAGGPRHLLHVYGPTENTTFSSWHPVESVPAEAHTVPIGRAVAHSSAFVLDGALRPVAVPIPGELYLGGDGVSRGYLGRPALTAERFVPDPFAAEPGARMYRTGDRVRWHPGGALEYLARLDGQVKIRGFRIERGEVEAALRRHPGVRECVVVPEEGGEGERRLLAYVAGEAPADELRSHLRRILPEYMVPAAFVVLDRLPLNPNGKLDTKALPAPGAPAGEDFAAPRTPVEEVLAGIWAEVLRLDAAGIHDSFFEQGGHSLLATRVVSRVREVFGVEVPLRALFENPTVAALAARVDEMRRTDVPALPPVVPVERKGPLPLSFAQERLWFLERLQPGNTSYNMPQALRLRGALDAAALERALGEVVRRHEALRTTFGEAGGAPVQVIHPFGGFHLPVEDLSALAADEREAAMRRRAAGEASAPFDLEAGPLLRASLLRLADREHVLLLGMHHIVSDGWSMGVLYRELVELYAACRDGVEPALPDLPVQYADFAVWQRAHLRGEALDRQMAYWTAALAGAPELLELPLDHPRPAAPSFRGDSVGVELPRELLERLRAIGRAEGATLYMVLLGAFQVLLSRYGGSDDVVVGSPIAGRTRRETEGLIGFFVNTLVLRTDLGGDPGFREVVRRVRGVTLGAYEHQDLPFEKLVAELAPERSLSHSPLFQVMFTLDGMEGVADAGAAGFAGLAVSTAAAAAGRAKFDLTLSLTSGAEGLRGELEYGTDLFERATIERMVAHLARVLEQVSANPDVPVSALELMDLSERRRVLEEWNRTGAAYPSDRGIHALFAAQAAAAPHAVALVHDGGSVTYGELNARANRLAHYLRRRGVGPEVRVGIGLERGVETIVAILATVKAGGAFVPLDPSYPAERIAFMLADSGAAVLVTQESLRAAFSASGLAVVVVDAEGDRIGAEPAEDPADVSGPRGLAYVMYTSGSTGTPKGVGVEHRAIVRLVRGASFARLGPDEVMLQAAPVSFDASTLEIWGALLNGGRLVLMPGAHAPTLEELGGAIVRHGVTTAWLTAGLFQVMVQERLGDLRGMRQLLAGGDVLAVGAVKTVLREVPECRLINGYGPTENTTFTCCFAIPTEWEGGSVPIGTPVSNTRVYVLDASLRPVPVGIPGELYTGGDGLARGYLGQPALTAERFVPDPFAAEPGGRMYRTGDRVRWKESAEVRERVSVEAGDGAAHADALTHSRTHALEFVGRLDGQVKIRGFRVERGEVEAVIAAHPGVREACVVVRQDVPGDRRLVAYVVGDADVDALHAHLRRALPPYMVPSAVVPMEQLPLTPNGKLDVRALPAPETELARDRYVPPRTPTEEVLAGIWAEVLGVERLGVEDAFFALGGHSLLAMRVVSRVREVFGVEVPLRSLFESPTVAALAARVEEMRRAGVPALPPVVPVRREGPVPLSFAQERLWFLDRLQPESTGYSMPQALRLRGALDTAALERALGEVVRRHEALRTTFGQADGAPVQVIHPFGGFALAVEDLSPLDGAEREATALRRAAAEAARPFDLEAGPLFRASLLRLGQAEHVLLLNMHHVVGDGWSMEVLFREVVALYGAFHAGHPSPLPELQVQYADFAAWQRAQLRGDVLEGQLAWWKRTLAGLPELLELPTDRPRPAVQSQRGALVSALLPAELVARLEALAREEGATLYMVMLAAWQALLSRYARTDDVVVGTPIAGRTRRETEGLIGFFVNTLVLRTDLGGDPAFREVVRRARDVTLGAYDHQEVPFEQLVAELHPERSLGHTPLFQVMYTLHESAGQGAPPLSGVVVEGLDGDTGTTKFDLTLTCARDGDGLRTLLEYNTDLFDAGTAERMLAHLALLVGQVAADPGRPVSRAELLTQAERARVLGAWNGTERPYPLDRGIHQLVAGQAARTPRAVALVHEDARVSYAALDGSANRLAAQLLERGMGRGAFVPVLARRGPHVAVAMLAAMKAGAAFVPLDATWPPERLRRVLDDLRAPLVLAGPGEADAARALGRDAVPVVIGEEGAPDPGIETGPEDPVYAIYTSGSTGVPKGAVVPHGGIANRFHWMTERLGAESARSVMQTTRHVYDSAVWQLFWPLTQGGRTVIPSDHGETDAAHLVGLIHGEGVTMTDFVPSVFNALVPELVASALARERLASLRTVIVGGEQITAETTYRFMDCFPGVRLINLYGPTECSIGSIHHDVHPSDGDRIPIGLPIANTSALLLDAGGRLVPRGVPGEIHLGGRCVGLGYLGDGRRTAAVFVPNPYAARPGERLYRTGDLGRYRADGTIECLGRIDQQVKIRGFRIEPGEIETLLRRQPGVRDCAVVVREDAPGDRRLVAYVAGGADAEALRAAVRAALPDYMVPAAFVEVEALPLTPGGKLDLRALPAPGPGGGEAEYVAPRTPAEETLAALWAQVLRVERVGAHDSFFEIGGHSLLAVRMLFLVRQAFRVELPLRAVFERPTVAALAKAVQDARGRAAPAPPIAPAGRPGRGDTFPLSFAQQRLWVMHQMQPGSTAYHLPYALRISGGLDVEVLARALTALGERHESLRTVFPVEAGVPVQRVLPPLPIVPEVTDLRQLPAGEREGEAARLARDEAARPFDLARGPLLRVRVLRVGDADDVVLLTLHHIVTDGWSQEILVRELSELYTAAAEGRDPVLSPLPVQYADYAAWQREWLSGAVLQEHLGYWRERLAGAPPLLELPTDRPRAAAPGDEGAVQPFSLSTEATARLRAEARAQGATLFMTLLAAFQAVLARWSGQDDVVVGTPVAGRTRPETEGVIGVFMNLLPLRTGLGDDPFFRALVARVRETVLDAHAHQELPFDRLVDALQTERSATISPVFQVLFSLEPPAGEGLRLRGLRAAPAAGAAAAAKYDLSLDLVDHGERLAGGLLYRPALFDAGTAARMLAQLARVLEQVADDPEVRVSRLELLDPAERRRVVQEWNRTDAEYPAHLCIHQLFQAQARRTPDDLAVVSGDASLTYRELDARANRLASHLVRAGVGPEARVGICLERGVELMVCVLGVMKAGGAYVPVDPGHPAERTGYVLRDSAVRMVLTQARLQDRLPVPPGAAVLAVDAEWERIAAEPADAPESGVTSENLCYVIYTSGSTGRPKGVAMHHRGVVNYIHWGVPFYGADTGNGAPVFSSMAVDLTITNLLPLFAGRPVHLLPEENAVEALAATLRQKPGFGLIKITPTHLALLTPLITPDEARAAAGTLVIGADALSAEPTVWWQRNAPDVRLMNEYGPTETVVGCSAYLLPNGVHQAGPVPVGGAIQNLRFYVLDGRMQPVPAGVSGELFIGGAGVARGYLGRPGLSAEKFVPDPFAAPGARMYRTGDRARWLEGGNLVILGRTDSQVKVRGYRVELGEIEAVLRRHPDVSACLVVLREDRPGDRRLVAYVVGGADPAELREHLRGSLPEYMVPAAFVRLESLPNTSTGKFDPRTLPAPVYESAAERYVAPRTPVEAALAEAWEQVLGVERVGVEDSFYELGGDSILAIQAASRSRRAGVRVTPRQMLEHHTITALAAVAELDPSSGTEDEVPDGAVPLTPIQAAFFSRDHPRPAHHNLAVLMRVDAAVADAALEAAFHAVIGHHDALRLRFRRTAEGWEQWHAAEPGIALERVDLSALAPDQRDRAQAEAADGRNASLRLEQGPLGRAVLFDRGEEGRILFMALHHLVVDGVSWRIILEDLDRACAQALAGTPVQLGPRSTSFQGWARALEAYAASDAMRAQAAYWLAQGADGTPPLPVDGSGEQSLAQARTVSVQLSAEETRALLQDVPGRYGTQINDVLLYALARAMERWTGSPRNRVALEGHGREEDVAPGLDLTRSLGWFTSIYPVVLDTTGATGVEARLSRVKEQLLAVPAHGVGYGVLRYLSPDAEVRRALEAQPEPGIIFNYLGQFDQGTAPELRVRFAAGPRGTDVALQNLRPYPIAVAGSVVGGQLSLHWSYAEGTHRRETVEQVAGWHLDALQTLIAGG
jgi:amino acid adenylation domain-containing protein/non-ribosomal peptide synthase protein (TIGR01720 family)